VGRTGIDDFDCVLPMAISSSSRVAARSWSYYMRAYGHVCRGFRNGPHLILRHHYRSDCARAVLWNGSELRGPAERTGFVDTVVEIWGNQPYTQRFYVPRDGDVILDVGANIGLFSVWIAQRAPFARVLAFEPFPENFAALKNNLATCVHDVHSYPFALGPVAGVGCMRDGGERSLDHELTPVVNGGSENITRVVSLEEVVDLAGVSQIDLLKMDIEGSEHDIFAAPLPPVLLRRFRRVAIEYHEHRRAGTLRVIKDRLSATHTICSEEDSGRGYGLLRAALA
jgi:FkbM family methyltransferase